MACFPPPPRSRPEVPGWGAGVRPIGSLCLTAVTVGFCLWLLTCPRRKWE